MQSICSQACELFGIGRDLAACYHGRGQRHTRDRGIFGAGLVYIDGGCYSSFPFTVCESVKMVSVRFSLSTLLVLASSNLGLGRSLSKRGPDDDFAKIALDNVYKVLNGTLKDGSTHTGCTKDNVIKRKE